MPKSNLLLPEAASAALASRFAREHAVWFFEDVDAGRWPLRVSLGAPTEREVAEDAAAVRAWVQAWAAWPRPEQVQWQTRQWPRLGEHSLPRAWVLAQPQQAADVVGQGARWRRAAARHAALLAACPGLRGMPARQRVFDAMADDGDDDAARLLALLRWVQQHPDSRLRLRQLPVEGLHTKWVEERRGLIADLASAWQSCSAPRDLHALLGLTAAPVRLRMRLLCPQLRQQLGGLCDIEAPLHEVAALPIVPSRVLIVENLETGLALPNIEGCVALMRLGHAVGLLEQLPWLYATARPRAVYWGDIDSHGFAILNRARAALPQIDSVLMDEATLLRWRHLCTQEPQPHPAAALPALTAAEHAVFEGLAQGRWGHRLRLEQERLPWPEAQAAVLRALAP
jgi:hypothetical protein